MVILVEIDYFFFCMVLMYVYMGYMWYEDIKFYEDWFWEKNCIDLKWGYVE